MTEFKEELEESTIEFDMGAFHAGLLVPALPLVKSRHIGVREIQEYVKEITKR